MWPVASATAQIMRDCRRQLTQKIRGRRRAGHVFGDAQDEFETVCFLLGRWFRAKTAKEGRLKKAAFDEDSWLQRVSDWTFLISRDSFWQHTCFSTLLQSRADYFRYGYIWESMFIYNNRIIFKCLELHNIHKCYYLRVWHTWPKHLHKTIPSGSWALENVSWEPNTVYWPPINRDQPRARVPNWTEEWNWCEKIWHVAVQVIFWVWLFVDER